MNHLAVFLPTLHGGGAERVTINLLKGFLRQDIAVDLVIANAEGPYVEQIPSQIQVVNLEVDRVIKAVYPLLRYLQEKKPYALISHMNHANVMAVIAKKLSHIQTRLILVEHNNLSLSKSKLLRSKFMPLAMQLTYPSADAIVGVSNGVAYDLAQRLGLPEKRVTTIYNPIVDDELIIQANAPLQHTWFQKGEPPVLIAVGRMTEQKDFITLIKAFASLRKKRQVRLMILGEGESRTELEAIIHKLEIAQDVALPGFVENPYAYMSRSKVFVLSSRWEGLPTVLIEAMACGCTVISTDCPSGPEEILESGKYGALVPVGNVSLLAEAMLKALEAPMSREILIQRAMHFSVDRATHEYLQLIKKIYDTQRTLVDSY